MKASRQDIYNAVIHRMVQESLTAKHEAFAQEHAQDTTEQLVTYIRACAVRLGHSPHQKEVIGWPMLTERFPASYGVYNFHSFRVYLISLSLITLGFCAT